MYVKKLWEEDKNKKERYIGIKGKKRVEVKQEKVYIKIVEYWKN